MIDQIHDLHIGKLDQTENLEYARIVLEAIVQAIDSTLNYWKSLASPLKQSYGRTSFDLRLIIC